MPALKSKSIASRLEPGMYPDGGNLYLRVSPSGAKSWIVRLVVHGRRRELGIGSTNTLSLADARVVAAEFKAKAARGIDPDAERKKRAAEEKAVRDAAAKAATDAAYRSIMTFAKAARMKHEELLPTWKNGKHAATWIGSLEKHVLPSLGSRPISDLVRDDVRSVLTPIWHTKPETARRLRQRMSAVFDFARDRGFFAGSNPVDELDLPIVKRIVEHQPAMPWREVPDFVAQLSHRGEMSAICLMFLILTGVRSGEARGANWPEIDVQSAIWTIPGSRMKRGLPHRVPLSAASLAVLKRARGLDPFFCFPSPSRAKDGQSRPLSDMAFKPLLRRLGVHGITVHGFRNSLTDWAREQARVDAEVVDHMLAHASGDAVRRAYARSDLFDRRSEVMNAWGEFVFGGTPEAHGSD